MKTGRVRKYHANFYYVEVEGSILECALRGLIKKEGTDVLAGDFVNVDNINPHNQTGRIHSVQPRQNSLSRPKMANVDQVVVVYSLHEPDFDFIQMDRYLTHAELAGLPPILCINKADLAKNPTELEQIQSLYGDRLGFPVLFTSTYQAETLQTLHERLRDQISVLAGPSGVGKSSLLNALNPGLELRVGEISEKITRGQHTTRHVELLQVFAEEPGTLVADTPGFSNLRFNYTLPRQIEAVFQEFAPYRSQCAFSDCLHREEEGCAVQENLSEIAESRWQSYGALIEEALEYKEEVQGSSQKEEYGYKEIRKKGGGNSDVVKILRLKEKNRDVSRRTSRQQVDLLETEADDWPDTDMLESDPTDSV